MIRSLCLALAAFATLVPATHAQVSYTGAPYLQNFDTLQGATNNVTGVTWMDNVTLPGWYAALTTGAVTTYGVTDGTMGGSVSAFDGTGSSPATNINNVGLFSFGTAASTDRALGSRATSNWTGHATVAFGVRLVNNTAQTITAFSVMFTGEQWHKNGGTTAHTFPLQYQIGATSITSGTWSPVVTFSSPVNTTTVATLAGNTSANRRGVAGRISGISWAPGAELWLRIADTNESGNEQALGIDDFIFTTENQSALFFDGATNHVTAGAATSTLGASVLTLEAWIYRTGLGTTTSTGTGGVTAYPIFAKGRGESESSGLNCNYFLGIDATNRLVADFEAAAASGITTGQNYPVTGTSTIPFQVWTHVAATYDPVAADGEKWKLYINGNKDTTAATPGVNPPANAAPEAISTQHFSIGTAMTSAGAREGTFMGLIDEVRVWNVARSAVEIFAGKDQEITTGAGLLGRFGLAEGAGTVAVNSANASANGTLSTAAPTWLHGRSFTPNTPPTVTLDSPTAAYTGSAPATVPFAATASDSDGSIAKVEFYQGSTKVGEDTSEPYSFDWTGVTMGNYSLTAVAIDNLGASATSGAVSITVSPSSNLAPTITLNSPANNATGIGSNVTLDVTVTDPESDPKVVTFYGRKTVPATPGADFTIVTLPDTQFYSENNNNRFSQFLSQTNWIVSSKNTLNTVFVAHMGDMVQSGDNGGNNVEWVRADQAMDIIEDPATTLLTHGIPWGGAPGNHDFGSGSGSGTTTFWNQFFGVSRWTGRPYFGGNYGANNNNNYQLFSASGLDFIVINLAYRTSADPAVHDWADALLKAYPNRRAIITSHWIINTGNPATFGGQGQAIYDNLKDNPNLFLLLCGHVHGEGQRSDTFEGRTVYSVLQDYQDRSGGAGGFGGGDGWLRYFVFSPANNTISAKTYRTTSGAFETDADSQFTFSYNMQSSLTGWIPLGTVNVPGGGTSATLAWTGLEAGSDYEWYAAVTDGVSTVNSPTRRFATVQPAAPVATLISPADGAAYGVPATINLAATASDTDGVVTAVTFHANGSPIATDTAEPYEFTWTDVPAGNYAITAVAVDNSGLTGTSAVANVTVTNLPPTVALTAPMNGASYDAPANIFIAANAADADGAVEKVEFFAGAVKVGEDATAPYELNWTGVGTGSYALTAKATDDHDAVTTSGVVNVTVVNLDNAAPAVAITSPGTGTTVAAGVPLVLKATATDGDGSIAKVEFFDGATLLGEDTTAPYSWTIAAPTEGEHTFTAKATDNDNGTTTSSGVSVTVSTAVFSYAQNFNGMGAGTAAPAGWTFFGAFGGGNNTWTNATGIPVNSVGGGTANATLTVTTAFTASSNTVGYNFADPGSTSDRALGTSPTTGQGVVLQLSLTNPTGAPITALRLGYDTRRFTTAGTANELPGYRVFYSLNNGTTWTNIAGLNPELSGAAVNVPNTVGTTTVSPTPFVLTGPWNSGAPLLMRWVDDNATQTSPDQIIGLDNVLLTVPIGEAPIVSISQPTEGAIFASGTSILIDADAVDTENVVAKVEFFQGTTKLGEDTTAPYSFAWNNVVDGAYALTVRATDGDDHTATSAPVNIVVDSTAPTITAPAGGFAPLTIATGANGRATLPSYIAQAVTADNRAVTSVTQFPAAGSEHAVGMVSVTLTAFDAAGNSASTSFDRSITDGTPPELVLPANIVAEAVSAAGAPVNFTVTANDLVDPNPVVNATPTSGDVFPIGVTTVNVTASDSTNNASAGSFTVTVSDTIAPVVTPPANVTVDATSAAGAVVSYPSATAIDAVGVTLIEYSHPSGSIFPIGTTTVTVTAYDAANNPGTATFSVTVNPLVPGVLGFASNTYHFNPVDGAGQPSLVVATIHRTVGTGGAVTVEVSGSAASPLTGFKSFVYGTHYQFADESAPGKTVVSFANGQATATVAMQLKTAAGSAKGRFALTLGTIDGGATLGSPASTTITINAKDAAKPVVVLTAPTGSSVTGDFNVTGTVQENVELASFVVKLNGAAQTLTANPLTAFAAGSPLPFSVLNVAPENGSNELVIEAIDTSGNKTTVTKKIAFVNNRPALAGTYHALLRATGVADYDTAGIMVVTVTSTGAFTGKATVGDLSVAIGGVINNAGAARFKPALGTVLDLFDKTDFESYLGALSFQVAAPDGLTGTLSTQANGGTVFANFVGKVAPYSSANTIAGSLLTQPTKGIYTVALLAKAQTPAMDESSYPQGDGFATVTLSNSGNVTLSGYLADGSKYTASGKLRVDESVALFTQLYKKRGGMGGELTFADLPDTDVAGADFLWFRPALSRSRYYRAGWASGVRIDAIGAKYMKPASLDFGQGGANLSMGNASLTFSGGGLALPVSKAISIDPVNGAVKLIPATNTSYKFSLSSGSGQFSGTFTHDSVTDSYRGILLDKGTNQGGFGYFLTTPPVIFGTSGQSGGVVLDPAGP